MGKKTVETERSWIATAYLLGLGTIPFGNYALAETSQSDAYKSKGYVWKGPDKTAMLTMEVFRLGLLIVGILDANPYFTAGWLVAGFVETLALARFWIQLPRD